MRLRQLRQLRHLNDQTLYGRNFCLLVTASPTGGAFERSSSIYEYRYSLRRIPDSERSQPCGNKPGICVKPEEALQCDWRLMSVEQTRGILRKTKKFQCRLARSAGGKYPRGEFAPYWCIAVTVAPPRRLCRSRAIVHCCSSCLDHF